MTVSSTRNFEFTVDQLCTDALEIANVTSPTQAPHEYQLAQARRFLQRVLKEVQDQGEFARSVTFIEITCISGTYKYDLPTDTLDLVGSGMYISASQTDLTKASGETLVQEQTRESWQRNSAKDAEGQPTLYFVNRAEVPNEVWVWPVPVEAGTIRFQQHRMLADVVNSGSATIDLKQFWDQYCLHKLAEMLANAANFPDKVKALGSTAEYYLRKAKGRANQAVNLQMRVGHQVGPYRRRR